MEVLIWSSGAFLIILLVYLAVKALAISYLEVSPFGFWRKSGFGGLRLLLMRRYRERVGSALLRFSHGALVLKEKMPSSLSLGDEEIRDIVKLAWQIRTGESRISFELEFRFTRSAAKDPRLRPLVMRMQAEIVELWKLYLAGLLLHLDREIRISLKVRG